MAENQPALHVISDFANRKREKEMSKVDLALI
jgi:hypothetical protein